MVTLFLGCGKTKQITINPATMPFGAQVKELTLGADVSIKVPTGSDWQVQVESGNGGKATVRSWLHSKTGVSLLVQVDPQEQNLAEKGSSELSMLMEDYSADYIKVAQAQNNNYKLGQKTAGFLGKHFVVQLDSSHGAQADYESVRSYLVATGSSVYVFIASGPLSNDKDVKSLADFVVRSLTSK